MPRCNDGSRSFWRKGAALLGAFLAILTVCAQEGVPEEAQKSLRIGTSGNLSLGASKDKEAAAVTTLKDFIKDETGLPNEIVRQKNWQELAQKMAGKELPVGVFQ